MRIRSLDLVLVGLVAFATLAACGREGALPPPPAATEAVAVTEAEAEKIQIRAPDGESLATIRLDDEHVTVRFDDQGVERVVHSRLDRNAKQRRYHERGGGPVALVRSHPELPVITVRAPDGALRWRVRFGKRRVSVADHPDRPAFELLRPNSQTVRVRYENGADLGRVSFARDSPAVQVHDAAGEHLYRVRSDRRSSSYGVLLVPDLDPVERHVLIAELLVRDE